MCSAAAGGVWPAAVATGPFGTGVLQAGPAVDVPAAGTPLVNVVGSAVGAFLTTLLVGALMVALAPEYTRDRMADVVERPLGCLGYGLVSLAVVVLVTVVLVVTIVGILVAVPFVILAYVVWAVGSAVAFLAIADRLVGHDEGWTRPLLVGAGVNGLLTLTGVGGLVSFCVGAAGFGAVLRGYLE